MGSKVRLTSKSCSLAGARPCKKDSTLASSVLIDAAAMQELKVARHLCSGDGGSKKGLQESVQELPDWR